MAFYKVTGPRPVFDAEPGSVIELPVDGSAKALVAAGHLSPVPAEAVKFAKKDDLSSEE